jgi:hypothetical protein
MDAPSVLRMSKEEVEGDRVIVLEILELIATLV